MKSKPKSSFKKQKGRLEEEPKGTDALSLPVMPQNIPDVKCVATSLFPSLGNLKRHMLVHEGVRPFPCQFCKKAFGQKSHMISHVKSMYEGPVKGCQKMHQCELCEKWFSTSGNLNRHVVTVHEGKKQYKCQVCEKEFSQDGHRKVYQKTCNNVMMIAVDSGNLEFFGYRNLQINQCESKIATPGI